MCVCNVVNSMLLVMTLLAGPWAEVEEVEGACSFPVESFLVLLVLDFLTGGLGLAREGRGDGSVPMHHGMRDRYIPLLLSTDSQTQLKALPSSYYSETRRGCDAAFGIASASRTVNKALGFCT